MRLSCINCDTELCKSMTEIDEICCICKGIKEENFCSECSMVVIEPYPGDNYELNTQEEKEMLRKDCR